MIMAGTRVLILYEGQPLTCYGCNEQGHLNQDCPRRRQAGTQRDDTYRHSWVNTVTQRPMRQQTATLRDAVPSQHSKHEVGMTEVLSVLEHRQEDPSASVNTADEESKMDTQTMDRETPRSKLSIRQACEGEDVNDILFDIETLKTHNTTTFADAPTRDTPIEDTGSRETPLEGEYGKLKSSACRGDNKADPSLNEDESLAQPSTNSPKRIKKLRTERDANFQREKT